MAAAATGETPCDLEKALECAVCLCLFDTPKVLACGHCLCAECVDGLVAEDGLLTCPECRQASVVPAAGLPTNHAAAAAVRQVVTQQQAETLLCTHCPRRLSTADAFVCEGCDYALVCARCAVTSHNGHRLTELPVAIECNQRRICEWEADVEGRIQTLGENKAWLSNSQGEFGRVADRLQSVLLAVRTDAKRNDDLQAALLLLDNVWESDFVELRGQGEVPLLTDVAVSLQNSTVDMAANVDQFVADRATLSHLVTELRDVLASCENAFKLAETNLEAQLKARQVELQGDNDDLRAKLKELQVEKDVLQLHLTQMEASIRSVSTNPPAAGEITDDALEEAKQENDTNSPPNEESVHSQCAVEEKTLQATVRKGLGKLAELRAAENEAAALRSQLDHLERQRAPVPGHSRQARRTAVAEYKPVGGIGRGAPLKTAPPSSVSPRPGAAPPFSPFAKAATVPTWTRLCLARVNNRGDGAAPSAGRTSGGADKDTRPQKKQTAGAFVPMFERHCYNCHELGHMSRECPY